MKRFFKFVCFVSIMTTCLICMVGVCGCGAHENSENSIICKYLEVSTIKNVDDGKGIMIKGRTELLDAIEGVKDEDVAEYNDDFFKEKTLIVIQIVEYYKPSRSEVKSYSVSGQTLTVRIEQTQSGDGAAMSYWYFMLEISNDEIEGVDTIKIDRSRL